MKVIRTAFSLFQFDLHDSFSSSSFFLTMILQIPQFQKFIDLLFFIAKAFALNKSQRRVKKERTENNNCSVLGMSALKRSKKIKDPRKSSSSPPIVFVVRSKLKLLKLRRFESIE